MVEQLARFLGISYDKAQLESMVEHCHQLIDQCCNAEALPVGRGMCVRLIHIIYEMLEWSGSIEHSAIMIIIHMAVVIEGYSPS